VPIRHVPAVGPIIASHHTSARPTAPTASDFRHYAVSAVPAMKASAFTMAVRFFSDHAGNQLRNLPGNQLPESFGAAACSAVPDSRRRLRKLPIDSPELRLILSAPHIDPWQCVCSST
jgi:hypothetical protein